MACFSPERVNPCNSPVATGSCSTAPNAAETDYCRAVITCSPCLELVVDGALTVGREN